MPIILRDGSMFGTLCAIDPKPHRLNVPGTVEMFELFAELTAFHTDSTGRLASSEEQARIQEIDAAGFSSAWRQGMA
jgi:hypothetical protein